LPWGVPYRTCLNSWRTADGYTILLTPQVVDCAIFAPQKMNPKAELQEPDEGTIG